MTSFDGPHNEKYYQNWANNNKTVDVHILFTKTARVNKFWRLFITSLHRTLKQLSRSDTIKNLVVIITD